MPYSLGALPDPPDERDYPFSLYGKTYPVLPATLDLRIAMGRVRDQGALGSCVAFAAAAVKEYFDRPQSEAGDNLSEQWLYGACKARDNYDGEGTFPRVAMDVLRTAGVPEERYQPYEARYPPRLQPLAGADENAVLYRSSAYAAVRPDQESMKAALFSAGPLMVAVEVWSSFFDTPSSGRVPWPTGVIEGYHAMAACGYTLDGMWIRNSWGANWGAAGYCLFPWSIWDRVAEGVWSLVDLPVVEKHWPDWPDNALLEQDLLWQAKVMEGYADGTFRPWALVYRRHVCLILSRLGMSYPAGGLSDYTLATRGWVRDNFPLPWQEERWEETLTRYQLALLVARSL